MAIFLSGCRKEDALLKVSLEYESLEMEPHCIKINFSLRLKKDGAKCE
jgi:hypothetical protein